MCQAWNGHPDHSSPIPWFPALLGQSRTVNTHTQVHMVVPGYKRHWMLNLWVNELMESDVRESITWFIYLLVSYCGYLVV